VTPDQVDVGTLALWAAACSTILTLGITVWNIFSSPARRSADRIEAQGKRIEDLERGLQRVEDRIAAMPSTTTMHELELMLTRLEGRLDTLNQRLQPVASIADRMQEWMLENGK
jgi:hypothetical protein